MSLFYHHSLKKSIAFFKKNVYFDKSISFTYGVLYRHLQTPASILSYTSFRSSNKPCKAVISLIRNKDTAYNLINPDPFVHARQGF